MQLFTSDEEHLNIPLHKLKKAKKKISFSEDGFPFIRKRKTTVVQSELVLFLLQKHSTGCLSSVQLALEVDDKLSLLLKRLHVT